MSAHHLLAISIGPVQGFIAAARRTRDLWYGSNLLSEISKATARAVRNEGGELIFPAPESPADLEPESALNVANVILAELRGLDPKMVARPAKEAAKDHWKKTAGEVLEEHRQFIRSDIWDAQVDDVIEFSAAWMPLGDGPDAYQVARRRVMRLLDGRKHAKDFRPAERKDLERIPK